MHAPHVDNNQNFTLAWSVSTYWISYVGMLPGCLQNANSWRQQRFFC